MNTSRRKFIWIASAASVGVLSVPVLPKLYNSITGGQRVSPHPLNKNFPADIDLEFTASPDQVQLLNGSKTNVYTYQTRILKAENASVDKLPGSYLGPVIRVKQGQNVRVRFKNQLPRESVIHWHGLHIPQKMDGHPMYAIDKGGEFVYEFTVNNRPGTYWFHPHPDKYTGPQVYYGLAGLFIVEGDETGLPDGEYDVPLVIQDRKIDADNQLVYLDGGRMARMQGFLGDRILVNGQPDWNLDVKKGTYRLRILNGSNSRIYKLAWSDGSDIVAIGTDGGLLEKPVTRPYLMLSPGERIEIWKDFSSHNDGEEVRLKSLSFKTGSPMGGGGMMGGMMGGGQQQTPNGTAFDLASFQVTPQAGVQKELPAAFAKHRILSPSDAVNANNPRTFHFSFERMQWVINGETFEMMGVADWEKVKLNTTEIWEFINGGGSRGMGRMGNMMQMPHPVHLHGLQFRIIDRDVSDMSASVWESVKDGFVDQGWQDTFLLMPGMKVQAVMKFEDFTGIFVYHCHNLEHEDMGMMRNYEVIA
ncbi:multicopper oxidase family protein [Prolixibacter sp. NT017]|uniref:multicopper oxidase family protein n=1 Tax=Prolixibacter sp. NT017 TaxID=2652390 RepID=UPI0012789A19|nr:multicopper oxidase family protein [Prolixibacter sp. NT017]GET25855.1 bilirubin oxidase [Prolixibacter sp. NT017]